MLLAFLLVGLSACSTLDSAFGSDEPRGVIGSEALDRSVGATDHQTGDGSGSAADPGFPDEPPPPDPALFDQARFEAEGCRFEIPLDLQVRCGTVEVPADWQTGEGTVSLAVAVFETISLDPAPDPVVYLEGGPGSHTLDTMIYSAGDLIVPLLERGEAVFFDQRGVGLSSPRLECPEIDDVTRQLEDDPAIDDESATAAGHDALSRCRERLIESGIDLTDYNSINNAHDVEAIRRALGYDQWNLYGISYGTKLGLEVLRRHPSAVRSAILDSVYPPQVDSVRDNPSTFVDSYRAVVAACGREPGCAADGDLAERIAAVVTELDRDPIQVEVRDWIGGVSDDIFVTGDTVAGLIMGALYNPYRFTDIPELIDQLELGETSALQTFLNQERSTERFFSTGMFYAFACHEEISFAERSEVTAALPPDPFGREGPFDLASNTGTAAFGTCEAFENGQAPVSSNTAVTSDVPTLLMAGTFDPVTPVSWAEAAAETLTGATVVVAPNQSHGVSPGVCGMTIVRQFLDQPGTDLDSSCLDEDELRFIADGGSSVALEEASFDVDLLGVSISTVRPEDWTVGTLGGDQYRQQSFLDPVQLVQLGGLSVASEILAAAFDEEFGVTLSPPSELDPGATVGSTPASELNRSWQRRSGRTETVAVEWFETETDGVPAFVVLSAPVDEIDGLLDEVVVPALQAILVQRQ